MSECNYKNNYILKQDIKHPFHILIKNNGFFEGKSLYVDLEKGSDILSSPLTLATKFSFLNPENKEYGIQERIFEFKISNIEELVRLNNLIKKYISLWKKEIFKKIK